MCESNATGQLQFDKTKWDGAEEPSISIFVKKKLYIVLYNREL